MISDYGEAIKKIAHINEYHKKTNIMEVCGTHTNSIGKFGIRNLLNPNINLISGPGCPVCVTPDAYIDYVYELSKRSDIVIATYGDMLRVPGSSAKNTLANAKALGAEIKMIYSSMHAVEFAKLNPNKKVVFLGIGFETTTPATAVAVLEAQKLNIDNFYVLSIHKRVEPVMRALLEDKDLRIDGFLIPGHVAVVIGEDGFRFLEEYNCTGVIAGFDMDDVIDGLYTLISCFEVNKPRIINAYRKLVRKEGNVTAINLINKVFDVRDDLWRGIGFVKNSGYKLKEEFNRFDIEKMYPVDLANSKKNLLCKCGEVLKGKLKPNECALFAKACKPENPVGPCMVSAEGSCAAYFRYNGGNV